MGRAGAIALGAVMTFAVGLAGGARHATAGETDRRDVLDALTAAPGNAAAGRALALARDRGNCGACHRLPGVADTLESSMGPSLDGVADRLSAPQIRARIMDARRLNPGTIMPSYYRAEGLTRVAKALQGKSVLSADEVEDVVAYMLTLRERKP